MTATLDPTTDAGATALEHLRTDETAWLTSVSATGQPYSSPVWFLWEDGELLVYSHRAARRNADIAARPKVAFNLNTDATGDVYLTMEGTARIDPDAPPGSANPTYLAKYEGRILGYGWTVDWFATEFPVAIRITPTRWRT